MAKSGNEPAAAPGGRTSSARRARAVAKAERASAMAAARRRRTLTTIVIAVVVVAVVGAIAGLVAYQRSQSGVDAAPAGVVAPPAGASATPAPSEGADSAQSAVTPDTDHQSTSTATGMGWGVGVGDADAAVTLELFEDFSCPHCNDLESSLGTKVKAAVASGTLRVIYYPMTLSGFGRPTELAANAFACAADAGKAEDYHDALYTNFEQAAQQWSNSFLTDIGDSVGLGADFGRCVRKGTFAEWVRSIDDTADARGVAGTPTAFIDGKLVPAQDMSAAGIMTDIEKAQ